MTSLNWLIMKVNQAQLLNLLVSVDNDFSPPLSSNVDLVEYSGKLVKSSKIFSKVITDELAGFCAVYYNTEQAYLPMLAVSMKFRGKNLAKTLLDEAICFLKLHQHQSLLLEVYKNNLGAISLYKKLGFKEVDCSEKSLFLKKKF